MSSIDKLLHSGVYSDLTITADGLSFKFHKAVIAGLSSALAEATETDKLELKCSTVTLTLVHDLFYNQPLDEKHTTLPELWGVYEFLHKYLCTDLAEQVHKKIDKSLVYADTTELVGFISALDKVNFGKEFLDKAIKQIARQLNTVSVSPIYCIKKDGDDCCLHGTIECHEFHQCCRHRYHVPEIAKPACLQAHKEFMVTIDHLSLETRTALVWAVRAL